MAKCGSRQETNVRRSHVWSHAHTPGGPDAEQPGGDRLRAREGRSGLEPRRRGASLKIAGHAERAQRPCLEQERPRVLEHSERSQLRPTLRLRGAQATEPLGLRESRGVRTSADARGAGLRGRPPRLPRRPPPSHAVPSFIVLKRDPTHHLPSHGHGSGVSTGFSRTRHPPRRKLCPR